MVRTISVEEAARRWREDAGFELIDVRTPMEYREVHADPARSVPLDRLSPSEVMSGRKGPGDAPLYLICRSGGRSRKAAEAFEREGFGNAVSIDGGTLAWEKAGLPVVRGPKAVISLERQVRIAAGSLVVLGTALGAFVHPGFLGIAAFVGAGLVFAGITDTCGMGLMLAKAPWNRVAPDVASCSTMEARS